MNKKIFIGIAILLSTILSVLSLYYFPDPYASHWGADGMANGYSSKGITLFILPLIQIFVVALMYVIPKVDPKKANVIKFKGEYETFILAFVAFFTYIHAAIFLWNTYFEYNFSLVMIPALAFFMFHVGNLVGSAKQNYMIGIRTPWTLVNGDVWDSTHAIASKYIKIGAIVSLIGLAFPTYGVYISIISIILPFIYAFVFSYFEFVNTVVEK